jgi:hypothetical protein
LALTQLARTTLTTPLFIQTISLTLKLSLALNPLSLNFVIKSFALGNEFDMPTFLLSFVLSKQSPHMPL